MKTEMCHFEKKFFCFNVQIEITIRPIICNLGPSSRSTCSVYNTFMYQKMMSMLKNILSIFVLFYYYIFIKW